MLNNKDLKILLEMGCEVCIVESFARIKIETYFDLPEVEEHR